MSRVLGVLRISLVPVLSYSLVPFTEKEAWRLKFARRFQVSSFPFDLSPSEAKFLLKGSRGKDPLPNLVETISGVSIKKSQGLAPYLEWALKTLEKQGRLLTSFTTKSVSFLTRSLEKVASKKNYPLLGILLKYAPSEYPESDFSYFSFRILFGLHKEISYGEEKKIEESLQVVEAVTNKGFSSKGEGILRKDLSLLASLVEALLPEEGGKKIEALMGAFE